MFCIIKIKSETNSHHSEESMSAQNRKSCNTAIRSACQRRMRRARRSSSAAVTGCDAPPCSSGSAQPRAPACGRARRCAAPKGQGEAAQACYGGAGKQRAGAPNRRNRDKVLVRYAGAERKAERRFLARAAEVVLCGATAQSGKRQAVCRNG